MYFVILILISQIWLKQGENVRSPKDALSTTTSKLRDFVRTAPLVSVLDVLLQNIVTITWL